MPDRLIRDELLDSERYLDLRGPLADTARVLFLHLVLRADDLGNAEASTATIRRRLLPRHRDDTPLTDAEIAEALALLVRADLLRMYAIDGKNYAHIPRFRQRLRSFKRVNPLPPPDVECSEMKELRSHLSDRSLPDDRLMVDRRRTVDGHVQLKGSEGSINKISKKRREQPTIAVDKSHPKEEPKAGPVQLRDVLKGAPINGSAAWFTTPEGIAREARLEGVSSPPGEKPEDLKTRVFAVKAARQRNAQ